MKDIPNFEGLYAATKEGNIWSHRSEKYLKPALLNRGHLHLILFNKDGIQKSLLVHRLVALTFIRNAKNKPQVNHKNGIKTDNRVSNLEWVTEIENKHHAFRTGLLKKIHVILREQKSRAL